MEMQPTTPIQKWLEHIRQLSVEIGTRGSTTPGERHGAEYCQSVFVRLGLTSKLETFSSSVSGFDPHLLFALCMLLSFIVYGFGGRIAAGIAVMIALIAFAGELLELALRDNFFRQVLPKGDSQNVFAEIPPHGEHRQDLVLIGHIDSQHTPLFFRTSTWVKVYQNYTTIAFALFILQIVLYLLGTVFQWSWIWLASIPSAVCALILGLFMFEGTRSTYTAGANDNASAVGMVLTLAEEIKAAPLEHTRVYAVCTGCEETTHNGAKTFFKNHRSEMMNPKGLVFELIGCSGPAWMIREGIVIPYHAGPGMVALIEKLNAAHPEWQAYRTSVSGGNTEMADCIEADVPAITFMGITRDGVMPYWHQPGDTFDKMDFAIMEKTYAMTWAFINALDQAS
jgi:hypothetical protein